MEAEICKYYGGASALYTLTFDDGCYLESSVEVVRIFEKIYRDTGIKIKATSAQTLNFLNDKLVSFWREQIKNGYFDLASHSVGHDVCYNSNTPLEIRESDAKNSKEGLEKIYSQKIYTFVTPGGGSDIEGRKILSKYYEATRNGNDKINDIENIDWHDISTFTATIDKTTGDYKQMIDKTIENGGWSVQINHWITSKEKDIFHSQRAHTFKEECEYLAECVKSKGLLVSSFNDAVSYIKRAKSARAQISCENDVYTLKIISELKGDFYDTPLTVLVKTHSDILLDNNRKISQDENGFVKIDVLNEACFTLLSK